MCQFIETDKISKVKHTIFNERSTNKQKKLNK